MWLQVAAWPEKFTTPTTYNLQTQSSFPYAYHMSNFQSASLDDYDSSSSPLVSSPIFKAFLSSQRLVRDKPFLVKLPSASRLC